MTTEPERRYLLIFAKSPDTGKVKTRISQQVGPQKAALIYEEMLGQIIRESAPRNQWTRLVFITPESDGGYFHRQGLHTMVQKGDNIGERMGNAFLDSVHLGAGKIILVGSDIPTLTREDIADAFKKLAEFPAVIGPSEDGGFYLFGLSKEYLPAVVQLFHQSIPWSSSAVLSDMEKWCRVYKLPLGYLPRKMDIDTYEDWASYQENLHRKK